MFAVHDIEDVLACPHTHNAELVDVELDQDEDWYGLCYGRGPESFIVALAGQLSSRLPNGDRH